MLLRRTIKSMLLDFMTIWPLCICDRVLVRPPVSEEGNYTRSTHHEFCVRRPLFGNFLQATKDKKQQKHQD